MKNVVLLGDSGSHPGSMITASGGVKNGSKSVCIDGDIFDCKARWPDDRPHGPQPVYSNYGHAKMNGKGILTTGATAVCGCVVTGSGSFKIFE